MKKENLTLVVAVIAILFAVTAYYNSSKPAAVSGKLAATADCGSVTCLTDLDVSNDLTVQAQFGVGTTTPSLIDISALSAATTTLGLFSSTSGKGGCLQLKGTNGTLYRMYATTTGPGIFEAGSCK